MKILIINGANLKYLGKREPEIYGKKNFKEYCEELKKNYKIDIDLVETNYEGEIIETIWEKEYDALIINPGGFSHTSIAIFDSLKALEKIKVEVHISNVYKREEFRKKLVTAEGCDVVISGAGLYGYNLAIEYILQYLK